MSNLGSIWTGFWHTPVRAERLAVTRILLGVALLTDLFVQYLPHFAIFYGPEGMAPAGLNDWWRLQLWHWTLFFFNMDDLAILYPLFGLWMLLTVAFILGWHTRITSVLLWFMTLCFHHRNRSILNFGDHLLEAALFLMMWSPSGRAWSLDQRRRRKKLPAQSPQSAEPPLTPAWPVRLLQIQLCMVYFSTGLAKLVTEDVLFQGSWWDGTSIHYALNNPTLARWSYAQFPLPLWVTAPLTYLSVWWEVLFPLLVLNRWTRKWTLWFGILFHIGIWLVLEAGWFSFYSISLYGVWIPDHFWERRDRRCAGPGTKP